MFEGYSDTKSCTKNTERQRRSSILHSTGILFETYTKVVISQETFLSNEHNRSRFISQRSRRLTENGISVNLASDNADLSVSYSDSYT